MVLRLFKRGWRSAMRILVYALFTNILVMPCAAYSSASPAPPEQNTYKAALPDALVTHYTGKIFAETSQNQWRGEILKCLQGTVLISTMEWPQEGKVSAMFTYAGKSTHIMGTLDKVSNSFEGHQILNDKLTLHLKGAVKRDSADASIWFALNVGGQSANDLCASTFTVYPSGQFLGS